MSLELVRTDVCIVGGGPAGVMLGLLLARAGVDVVVLEKHDDFFRDFRGDTVHPSTLDLIDRLGLRREFDAIPHKPLPRLDAVINGLRIHVIDFSSLPAPNRAMTLMPQWDLLSLLAEAGAGHPGFRIVMGAEVDGLVREGGRVVGVGAAHGSGRLEVRARLTVATDGRASVVRRLLGLDVHEYGVPVDVLWFRLENRAEPLPDTLAYARDGIELVTLPRPDYLQCGMLIAKGGFERIRSEGLSAFRERIVAASPRLEAVASALDDWDRVRLLSVQIGRLRRWWRPGALCIGDAAHAMSPVFGVGVNYAIQDAVAAANLLAPALRRGAADAELDGLLAAVQRRREPPTVLMQGLQRRAHDLIGTGAGFTAPHNPPTPFERLVMRTALPLLRPIAARVVGRGFRPERIRS